MEFRHFLSSVLEHLIYRALYFTERKRYFTYIHVDFHFNSFQVLPSPHVDFSYPCMRYIVSLDDVRFKRVIVNKIFQQMHC